jgi:spore coat polysaccharide biosynthesis protein SpsF
MKTSNNMKVVAIIQARMSSSRLPGKVLLDINGEPMLSRVVNRTLRAKKLDAVMIATTTASVDDVIADLCEMRSLPYYRGSEKDVLDRYYQAALVCKAGIIVRITADSPLIEPDIIDKVVDEFLLYTPEVDFVSNSLTRTYPLGLNVSVMSFSAIKKAWCEDQNPAWREHVTPYIYRHPEKFRLRNVSNDTDYSSLRWTVDTTADLTFVRKIYEHFQDDTFTWIEVVDLLEMHPEWMEINRHIRQRKVS